MLSAEEGTITHNSVATKAKVHGAAIRLRRRVQILGPVRLSIELQLRQPWFFCFVLKSSDLMAKFYWRPLCTSGLDRIVEFLL